MKSKNKRKRLLTRDSVALRQLVEELSVAPADRKPAGQAAQLQVSRAAGDTKRRIVASKDSGRAPQTTRGQLRREISMGRRITETFLGCSGDEVYSKVLGILLEATKSKRGVFGFINENGSYVVPPITPQVQNESHLQDEARVFPEVAWGDTAGVRAIREKRTICSNQRPAVAPRADVPIHQCVSVPIVDHGKVMGLLQVANKGADYDQKDIELLETAAAFIAPFLAVRLRQERPGDSRKQERPAQQSPAAKPQQTEIVEPKSEKGETRRQDPPPEPLTEVPEETLIDENRHEIGEPEDQGLQNPGKVLRDAASFWLHVSRAIATFARVYKPLNEPKQASMPRKLRYVLLITSNPATVESVTAALHSVRDVDMVGVANSREEGLAMAQDLSPDVIVVDLSYVGMSALRSIYDLRQELPSVGIVATCRVASTTLKRSAIECGADQFILISRLDKDLLPAVRGQVISETVSSTPYLIRTPPPDVAHKGQMN